LLVFYISGHGFGHASRDIEIINAVGRRRPDVPIVIRTSAARWLFDLTVTTPVTIESLDVDPGVVQIDSLLLDEAATVSRAAAFYRDLDDRAGEEAHRLAGARLVVGDIPPLAFAAAACAGVPAVAVGNFTWDWIYEGYAVEASAPWLLPAIRRAYARAAEAWRLPMSAGFAPFEPVRDIPFVARRSRHDRAAARRAIGLPLDRRIVLLSFGGFGLDRLDLDRAARHAGCLLVTTDGAGGNGALIARRGPDVAIVDEWLLYSSGHRYEDLVAAADLVVTKPGYGIIAECIANDTAMLYTSRGRFAEYDVLVREIPRFLRARFIANAKLLAGDWRAEIETLLASPPPPERPAVDGAHVVAEMIAARI
jgi:L-arabinokinase